LIQAHLGDTWQAWLWCYPEALTKLRATIDLLRDAETALEFRAAKSFVTGVRLLEMAQLESKLWLLAPTSLRERALTPITSRNAFTSLKRCARVAPAPNSQV
jgi:hypothetical protein